MSSKPPNHPHIFQSGSIPGTPYYHMYTTPKCPSFNQPTLKSFFPYMHKSIVKTALVGFPMSSIFPSYEVGRVRNTRVTVVFCSKSRRCTCNRISSSSRRRNSTSNTLCSSVWFSSSSSFACASARVHVSYLGPVVGLVPPGVDVDSLTLNLCSLLQRNLTELLLCVVLIPDVDHLRVSMRER